MATTRITVTRKGQVTIPIELRRTLGIHEGDQLEAELQGDSVILRRSVGVAQRTAGALAAYRRERALSLTEERQAFEQSVADDVSASMEG